MEFHYQRKDLRHRGKQHHQTYISSLPISSKQTYNDSCESKREEALSVIASPLTVEYCTSHLTEHRHETSIKHGFFLMHSYRADSGHILFPRRDRGCEIISHPAHLSLCEAFGGLMKPHCGPFATHKQLCVIASCSVPNNCGR